MRSVLSMVAAVSWLTAAPALAQQVPFERSFEVPANAVLDISTIRGKIEVTSGEVGRVRVTGTATVRLGFNVPSNAFDLAKRAAANPPVGRDGDTIRLGPPVTEEERRAMTISYQVQVPKSARVRIVTDSGATTVRGVSGAVEVRTGSSSIDLQDLGGAAEVITQSGAVRLDDVAGDVSVRTGSSAITLRGLGAGLRARTHSGAVDARFRGQGNVDVETSSGAVSLTDVHGGLTATTQSGQIHVSGAPTAPWQLTSGSGSYELAFDRGAKLTLEATSRSGSVRVDGDGFVGSLSKGRATGAIGGGGPLVRVANRSGSIEITLR